LGIILKIVSKVSLDNKFKVFFFFFILCIILTINNHLLLLFFIGNELIPLEEIGEEDSPYLTLEEAEQLALEKKEKVHCKKWARESKDQVGI